MSRNYAHIVVSEHGWRGPWIRVHDHALASSIGLIRRLPEHGTITAVRNIRIIEAPPHLPDVGSLAWQLSPLYTHDQVCASLCRLQQTGHVLDLSRMSDTEARKILAFHAQTFNIKPKRNLLISLETANRFVIHPDHALDQASGCSEQEGVILQTIRRMCGAALMPACWWILNRASVVVDKRPEETGFLVDTSQIIVPGFREFFQDLLLGDFRLRQASVSKPLMLGTRVIVAVGLSAIAGE